MVVLFALASAGQYFISFWKRLDIRIKRRVSTHREVLRTGEKEQEEKDVAAQ
jgi:hypothetical protein